MLKTETPYHPNKQMQKIGDVIGMEISKKEQRAARLEIAVLLCINSPRIYRRATNPRYTPIKAVEDDIKVSLLRSIINEDPAIRNTLAFYHKRGEC
jgi:hypothetical protein